MKHLKRFNESTSFNWLNKYNNEKYFELSEILQSKLFDDFDIISATDENFDIDDDYPTHKLWSFRINGKAPVPTSEINNGIIDAIFIYNITEDEKDRFYNSLIELDGLVDDILGKELIISVETFDLVSNKSIGLVYDYTIKLK